MIPIVNQEFKVCIDIICIYDRVLLVYMKIHVVPPLPHSTSFANYHFYTPQYIPWACFRPKNYSDLGDILLFLSFLFSIFILGGFFFAILSKVNIMNNSMKTIIHRRSHFCFNIYLICMVNLLLNRMCKNTLE